MACGLEGACRKWLVPTGEVWIDGLFYFSKDIILILAVLLIAASRTRACPQLVHLPDALAVMAVIVLAASVLNLPGSPPVGAMLSFRSFLLLPALALALTLVNAIIGTLQYYLPNDYFLNQHVAGGRTVVEIGRVRASGTFSFITGLAHLPIVGSWAGCILLLMRPIPKSAYVFTAAALICPPASLSRTGLVFSLGLLTSVLVISRGGIRAAVPLIALFIGLGPVLPGNGEHRGEASGMMDGIARRHQVSDSFEVRVGLILGDIPKACGRWATFERSLWQP